MDSRELMLVQKQDELARLDLTPKDIRLAKSLLPTEKIIGRYMERRVVCEKPKD